MEQIRRIRDLLSGLDFTFCSKSYVIRCYDNVIDVWLSCSTFYREVLNKVRNDLESKGNSAGIAAVDAALEALGALSNSVGRQSVCHDENREHDINCCFDSFFGSFSNYFQRVDDMKENFPRLFDRFKDTVEKMLQYVDKDLKFQETESSGSEASLKSIFLDLLEMEGGCGHTFFVTRGHRRLSTFLRHLNDNLGLHVFGKYFGYAVDDASLGCLGEVERELDALEKEISRYMLPKAQGARVQGALRDVRESIGSLIQKLQALRAAYDQAVADLKQTTRQNRASFAPKFNELDQMLGEASSGLDDLRQKIDELEKALLPPLRLHGRLGLVFAAILVVQCILWYLEEEDSATRRAWNTGVYSLAVAGTIVYQVWRLATRYRDDGVIGMLREEWTAVGCIVPMAAGLLHGGVVRSSVYSMTVAGIGAVMMAV
ncbi:DUF1686 domain-containing protein [Encephalitozoon cuniculi]|nr:DUF1686 domain-containing protein [Encephalitozoon cuniculi]